MRKTVFLSLACAKKEGQVTVDRMSRGQFQMPTSGLCRMPEYVCSQRVGQSQQQRSADRDKGKTMCLFHCRPAENSPISAEPRCRDVRGGTGGMCGADVTSSVPVFFFFSFFFH